MKKIRKGDDVIVTTGRDKGKRGTVLRIVDADHVVVEGANRVKKHQRPIPMKGITGGIIDKEMPLHVSNVALYNPGTKKADRVGYNAGVDLTFFFSRYVGVGGLVRTSRATVKLPTPDGHKVDVDAGGTQVGAGMRFRF